MCRTHLATLLQNVAWCRNAWIPIRRICMLISELQELAHHPIFPASTVRAAWSSARRISMIDTFMRALCLARFLSLARVLVTCKLAIETSRFCFVFSLMFERREKICWLQCMWFKCVLVFFVADFFVFHRFVTFTRENPGMNIVVCLVQLSKTTNEIVALNEPYR